MTYDVRLSGRVVARVYSIHFGENRIVHSAHTLAYILYPFVRFSLSLYIYMYIYIRPDHCCRFGHWPLYTIIIIIVYSQYVYNNNTILRRTTLAGRSHNNPFFLSFRIFDFLIHRIRNDDRPHIIQRCARTHTHTHTRV